MLLLIALLVGGFLWWRTRRTRLRGLPLGFGSTAEEEHIPLNSSVGDFDGNGNGHAPSPAPGSAPRAQRPLVPFEANSDLWPYPRAPLDDRSFP